MKLRGGAKGRRVGRRELRNLVICVPFLPSVSNEVKHVAALHTPARKMTRRMKSRGSSREKEAGGGAQGKKGTDGGWGGEGKRVYVSSASIIMRNHISFFCFRRS